MITTIRKKILNDFYRSEAKKHVSELQKTQWNSMENHVNRQLKKLAKTLELARSVPYYSTLLSGTEYNSDPLVALKKLPIIDKQTIINNENLFINPWIKPKGRGTTSGTTGLMSSFSFDETLLDNSETLSRFFKGWFGIEVGDRGLKIWGRPITGYKDKLHLFLSDLLRGMVTIDGWDLSSDSLQNKWNKIIRSNPAYIYGYATSISTLAKWIENSELQSTARDLGLKAIICTSETLLKSNKQKIKDVFGCPVVEEYGAAESSIIAHECLDGNFHIASENLFLECVDDFGNDVRLGQAGNLLVTCFFNRVQPFIRYRLGDIGTLLPSPCPCGRGLPIMKLNVAKTLELIKTKSGKIFSGVIIDYINFALMENPKNGVRQFRVTQKDLSTFSIEIVPDEQFNNQSKDNFTQLFSEQLGEKDLTLLFDIKDKITPLPSGKILSFQSEIP
jgi:phenylacetate-CoA ligase